MTTAATPVLTHVLSLDPHVPQPDVIQQAAACLARGGLVAFPTETVYGVGALADDANAVARLAAAKGRASEKPFAQLVADDGQAERVAEVGAAVAQQLMRRFWPGPLTLVLPSRAGGTIGLRCPDHPVAQALLAAVGRPLVATSANRSGAADARTAAEVAASLGDAIDLILDAGPARAGQPSTVVEVTGTAGYRILSDGAVSRAALVAALA